MKKWIPKNKLLVTMASVALLSAALYVISLSMVLLEIKKIENIYSDTESSTARNRRAEALGSIADQNAKEIQTLRDFFVHKGDEVRFIEQIEETARKSSISFEIVSIEVKQGQADAFREDVTVSMKISGPWNGIMSFFDSLDKMYFGASVQNIDLDTGPNGWAGTVDFIVSREK